ncbi:MAG TPA: hypothetical protein VEW93_06915 [Acidimicrobiales bacterium]|nr:hypothetical protein [Acidimicrobiales bacterium]
MGISMAGRCLLRAVLAMTVLMVACGGSPASDGESTRADGNATTTAVAPSPSPRGAEAGPGSELRPAAELDETVTAFGVEARVIDLRAERSNDAEFYLGVEVELRLVGRAARLEGAEVVCGSTLEEISSGYRPLPGEAIGDELEELGTAPSTHQTVDFSLPTELPAACAEGEAAWLVLKLGGGRQEDYELDTSQPGDGVETEEYDRTVGVLPLPVDLGAVIDNLASPPGGVPTVAELCDALAAALTEDVPRLRDDECAYGVSVDELALAATVGLDSAAGNREDPRLSLTETIGEVEIWEGALSSDEIGTNRNILTALVGPSSLWVSYDAAVVDREVVRDVVVELAAE